MPRLYNSVSVYPLPDAVPDADICARVQVPDSVYFIEMFVAHLERLSYWFTYDRDADRTGKAAADRWRQSLQTLRFGQCGPVAGVNSRPGWLRGGGGCWTIDVYELDGVLNILQPAQFCQPVEPCQPQGDWQLVEPGGDDEVNQPDFSNLQQQIDALSNEIDALEAQREADALAARRRRIGSLRWYPKAAAPFGWVPLFSQIYPQEDYPTLYDRVPDAWRTSGGGRQVVQLPNAIDALPYGFGGAGTFTGDIADGEQKDAYLKLADATGYERIRVMRGRWYIYIGEEGD